MGRILRVVLLVVIPVVVVSFGFGQDDLAKSKDYPNISRMPGYFIKEYKETPFDSYTFPVTADGKKKDQAVEGHLYQIGYGCKTGTQCASDLQIVRNYQNAARAAGGQVLNDEGRDDRDTTLRMRKGNSDIWARVMTRGGGKVYYLVIIEMQAMQQDVSVDAAGMARDIASAGSVAIYGIYFDTAKADLKPESATALAEIAKLLKQSPTLKIFVVGHTDMVGDLATNMKLSQARAQAVVNALVSQHGIAAARLTAFGNGPYAPVATNKTEEGRAKNRRVELVEVATN